MVIGESSISQEENAVISPESEIGKTNLGNMSLPENQT